MDICGHKNVNLDSLCEPCGIELQDGKLDPEDFNKYLSWFLKDNPSKECPKGGHAAYSRAIALRKDGENNMTSVGATYFMTYHTILKSSADYTNALREARKLAQNITKSLNAGWFQIITYK